MQCVKFAKCFSLLSYRLARARKASYVKPSAFTSGSGAVAAGMAPSTLAIRSSKGGLSSWIRSK